MKKLQLIFLFLLCGMGLSSFPQVGIGITTPNGNSMLDVYSTSKGVLFPRMTFTQICSIASPSNGLLVFCTNCGGGSGRLYIYEGNSWHSFGTSKIAHPLCGNSVYYYPVEAAGYTWLDRNLGASRTATSGNDYMAYGMHYQWGRKSDGHQCITWTSSNNGTYTNGTTTMQCSNGTCTNSLFVIKTTDFYDWNAPTDNLLWNESSRGINDPCPKGYRVPSQAELQTLADSFSPNNSIGALASPVRMSLPGYRYYQNGNLYSASVNGLYWTSTFYDESNAYYLRISSNTSIMQYFVRVSGYSVRCISQ